MGRVRGVGKLSSRYSGACTRGLGIIVWAAGHERDDMRRLWTAALATAVVIGVGTSAAGASAGARTSSTRAAASVPKACDLFTSPIAAAALGGPVDPPTATKPNPKETICKYTRTDKSAFGSVSVGPWIIVQIPGKSAKIPGIGDQAQGKDPFGVSVRKGSNGFNVDLALAAGDFTGQAATDQATANINAATNVAKQLVVNFGKAKKTK